MQRRTFFFFYFAAIFFQAGTFGLTFLLPPLFAGFGADEKDVGTVLAITMVTTLISVLYLGHITARLGRMVTVGVSGILIAISLFLFGTVSRMGFQLYLAGGLLGVGWGLFYVLTPVVVTQVIEKSERVRYFTLLSVFIMAGFGLSPVLGAYFVKTGHGIEITFLVTSALCIFSSAVFFVLAKPLARLSLTEDAEDRNLLSLESLGALLKTRALRPIIMVWLGASVFASVTNFQTVYADLNNFDYADYFLAYTVTVIVCRVLLAEFMGGRAPYAVIAALLAVMVASVGLFLVLGDSRLLYVIGAILFGIGYGVSYPIVKAMAANDAEPALMSQTLQVFGFAYFIGVFGFPFVAGWVLTETSVGVLLCIALAMAALECLLAALRHWRDRKYE
jgi:MFS family permease